MTWYQLSPPKVNSQQTGVQFEPFWALHGEDLPPFLTRSHQNCPNHRSYEAVQLWSLLHQVAKLRSNPWKRIWCASWEMLRHILNALKTYFKSLGVEIQVQTSFFPPAMARHGVAKCVCVWFSFARLGQLCWHQVTVLWLSIMVNTHRRNQTWLVSCRFYSI